MKIIVGLGNPGKKYENTRHNMGFRTIEALNQIPNFKWPLRGNRSAINQIPKHNKKFNAEITKGMINNEKILLVKPQTFMNDSGKAVKLISDFYKIKPKDIWVIADDINLPIGKIRIRTGGSSGGHKGLQSIIDFLGTDNFPRFRIGIRDEIFDLKKISQERYVLDKFSKEELRIIEKSISLVILEIKKALESGICNLSF